MSELRKDPVLGKWVVLSEARGKRPSDFKQDLQPSQPRRSACAFCQGHEHETGAELFAFRQGSLVGAPDWRVRVVKNIYPAVSMESLASFDEPAAKDEHEEEGPFHRCRIPGTGSHEVVIETPLHDVKFTSLSDCNVEEILSCFRHRICELRGNGHFKYVQVFKNQGKAAGASMEHAHSQIIALPIIPHQVELEIDNARTYFDKKGRCIFCDILEHDIADGSRLIDCSTEYAVLAPYAPKYPYETWIVPRIHASNFENVDDLQLQSLAKVLLSTLRKMEHLFGDVPFNYMLHTSPVQDHDNGSFYHWSIRVIPHLITLGGFELGSGCHILPVYPEKAASELREIKLESTL
eukprot:c26009_g1_i1 orf=162-1211(+)